MSETQPSLFSERGRTPQLSQWNLTSIDLYNLVLRHMIKQEQDKPQNQKKPQLFSRSKKDTVDQAKAAAAAKIQERRLALNLAIKCAEELNDLSIGSFWTSDDPWLDMDRIRIMGDKVVDRHSCETNRFRDGTFSTPRSILATFSEFRDICLEERRADIIAFDLTYCTPVLDPVNKIDQVDTHYTPLLWSGTSPSMKGSAVIKTGIRQTKDNVQKDNNQWVIARLVTSGLGLSDPVLYRSIPRTQKFDGGIPKDVLTCACLIPSFREELFAALLLDDQALSCEECARQRAAFCAMVKQK